MVRIGDKLTFNYGGTFPTKVGTVRSIVPSSYSKGGAFADVIIGKRKDGFAEITKMFEGAGCRSTMVGDMVLIGTEKFKVEPMGWSKI